MAGFKAKGPDDLGEGGGDHGWGEDGKARGGGQEKKGGGSLDKHKEGLKGRHRAQGGGVEGWNLNHLVGIRGLHRLAPF